MLKKIKISQISDIHISPTAEPFQKIDVRQNFVKVLEKVQEGKPDAIVLSGDLAADEGEPGAYEWIQQQIKDISVPVFIMAGNHDLVANMRLHFNIQHLITNGMLYYSVELQGHPILFLDTSTDTLPTEQMDWLVKESAKHKQQVLLFMHHPPALANCLFMDTRYPLKNIEESRGALNMCANIKQIFVGHYHTETDVHQDNKNIYVTPSTMMQISQKHRNFMIDHLKPGWRDIVWDGENLETSVKYL